MENQYGLMLTYILGAISLLLIGRVLFTRMKILFRLVYNFLVGAVALLIINYIGNMFQFHINFNIFTSLVIGILGLPGIALLVILNSVLEI